MSVSDSISALCVWYFVDFQRVFGFSVSLHSDVLGILYLFIILISVDIFLFLPILPCLHFPATCSED